MGFDHSRHARRIDANVIGLYHSDLTRLMTLDKTTAGKTIITGQALTGNTLEIHANDINAYPFIRMTGNDALYLVGKAKVDIGIDGVLYARFLSTGGGGSLHLKECTTPAAIADYGALYTKADNELYFQTGAGVEKTVTTV